MGLHRRLVRASRAAPRALFHHRLRVERPDGKPMKYGVAIVDVCTGMLASNSILAALNARHRTGKGQKVEVSLYETSLAMLVNVAASYLAAGRNAGRFGNGHPSIVPYTTYQAADGMIALGI